MTENAPSGLGEGASALTPLSGPDQPMSRSDLRSSVLHVCTSCRMPGSAREPRENRPGFKLYQKLRAAFSDSPVGHHVQVRAADCLSVCPRPCGIALGSPGAWSYIFGEQHPSESVSEIVQCASLYIATSDGFMPREQRPKSLRSSILGRVPPFEERR